MDGNKKITGIVFAAIIALAITACKVQSPGYVGLYIDNLKSINDTIYPGEAPLNMLDTALNHVVNPTSFIDAKLLDYQMNELQKQLAVIPEPGFTGEKQQQFLPRDSLQTEVDFRQLIQDKNEKIFELQKQLNELQNFGIIKSDASYVIRETVKSPIAKSQQSDYLSQQMLMDTNDKIQKLQKQLNSMQNTAFRTPRQSNIRRETSQVQPLSKRQTDQLNLQMFQAQNDTIQILKSQIQNLQLQLQKRDFVYIEKEAKEMQPAKELVAEQKVSDPFQELQNTIQLLKNRVLSLEEQNLSVKETPALAIQDEADVPHKVTRDTTLLVAYYKLGETKPIDLESVLKQIKEIYINKNVTKITLSGFTDSSGNATINKAITNKRLNYLSEKMTPWISKEKIFFQNFGDVFASDTIVSDERRIEIRIHTK